MTGGPWSLSLAEAAARIRDGILSPVTLAESCLARIAAFDPSLRTFITLIADQALEQARTAAAEIAAGRYRGPLHGIPFGLKDIIDVADVPTTCNSRIGIGNVPTVDATVTACLTRAGGVLLGKLATWEFAHGIPPLDMAWPPPRNPWNLDHATGGSSSGSAAAVAAGFLPASLGSDTGGSVRGPAALCGVVGLKPTYGLVSRAGVVPNSFTFDHCGPLTRTVEDAALLLQAIAGPDPCDPASADRPVPNYRAALVGDLRGLRIGVLRHVWEEDLPAGPEVSAMMEASLGVLADRGATIAEARIRPIQDYYDIKTVIAEAEIFAVHQCDLVERLADFGPDFLARTLAGCLFTAADYVQAQRERRRMLAEVAPLFARFDVLVTCGTGTAPRLDAPDMLDYRVKWSRPNPYTPFNVLGGPALVVCAGFGGGGLPLALQIVGRPFDEATVLRVGHAYETATPWHTRRPTLPPAPPPWPTAPATTTDEPAADASIHGQVETFTRNAGLRLPEALFETLCAVAPLAFAMAARIRRDRDWAAEPASVFRFPA